MTSIFFAGYFTKDRPLESVAAYTAKIVDKNTKNGKYCGLTVQATADSGDIADSYLEFHTLYGSFRQTKVTFGSAMNLYNAEKKDKDHDIRIQLDSKNVSDNLSLFYLGPIGSSPTNGHFRHYVYPLETMFQDVRSKYDLVPRKYVAYISQTHADNLLEMHGETKDEHGKYTEEQYRTLLDDSDRNVIDISFDSVSFKFAILNIYFKTGYYFEGINEMLSDFIAVSYFAPQNLRKEQKNIYFLSEYPYQNEYFMNYVNELYSNGKYKVEINHNNIIGQVNDEYATSFYYENLKNSHTFTLIILLMLSFALVFLSGFTIYKNKYYQSWLLITIYLVACLLPYLIFRLIYRFTYSINFFTFFSCKVYFITLFIIGIALFLLKYMFRLLEKRKKLLGDVFNEIDI